MITRSFRQLDHLAVAVPRENLFDHHLCRSVPGRQGTKLFQRRIQVIGTKQIQRGFVIRDQCIGDLVCADRRVTDQFRDLHR